jgi:hypothetical protein
MKLWIDDMRPAPEGYWRILSVNEAKFVIEMAERRFSKGEKFLLEGKRIKHPLPIELIDIDHDAGNFFKCGGDYIKLLDWLEETGRNYPIRIHSQNPVGIQNMRAIIQRNGWKEIK